MEEAKQSTVDELEAPASLKYPIYLLQNGRIHIRLSSPTEMQMIYGEEFPGGRWEWYSSSHQISAYTVEAMLQDPSYLAVEQETFHAIRTRYLDFHRRLLHQMGR